MDKLKEVIRQEGNKWILYTKDGSKRLGEFDTKEEAEERERQIQYFKHQEADVIAGPGGECVCPECDHRVPHETGQPCTSRECPKCGHLMVRAILTEEAIASLLEKKHSAAWHRCVDNIGSGYNPYAVCTAVLKKTGNVYASIREADGPVVVVTLEDAQEIDDRLAAEMKKKGIKELHINTETWELEEIPETLPEEEATEGLVEARQIKDTWDRKLTEARIDKNGNLSGIVLIEGESANSNVYTLKALKSAPQIFAGKPIYADHPSRSEQHDRPERSVKDLVGKLPENPTDLWVEAIKEGSYAGKRALFYRSGTLSKTANWLATLIRERIAGAQSINAWGTGRDEDGKFIVEAFTDAVSLDFVTQAAAGGRGELQESMQQRNEDTRKIILESLTLADFAKMRPDIVNSIAIRERKKAYGERAQLQKLQEEVQMSKKLAEEVARLNKSVQMVQHTARQQRAQEVIGEATKGLPPMQAARVRQLMEASVRRFVEQEEEMPEETGAIAPTGADLEPGSPPTIELPPDVAELTAEQQAVWLKAYTDAITEGIEEVKAVHKAWAAVIAGEEEGGEEVPAEVIPEELGTPVVTEAKLLQLARQAVEQERKYLGQFAGNVVGMGQSVAVTREGQPPEDDIDVEGSFKKMGLTETEAKTAAKGRHPW